MRSRRILVSTGGDGRRLSPLRLAISAMLLLGLVVAACSGDDSESSAATGDSGEGTEQGAFKVAILGDLSGALSENGIAGVAGIRTAIDEANEDGGIEGRLITYGTPLDTRSSPDAATVSIRQAVSDDPLAVVSATNSGNIAAMTPTFEQSQTAWFANQSLDTLTNPPEPWYWTVWPTSEQQAEIYVSGMTEMLGGSLDGKKIATVALNVPSAMGTGDLVKPLVEEAGGSVVAAEIAELGASSFTSQAGNIANADPDGVITIDSHTGTTLEVTALRTAGFDGPVIASVGATDDVLVESLDDDNFFVPRVFNTLEASDDLQAAADSAGTSRDATSAYFASGYASGRALVEALRACGADCTAETLPEAVGTLDAIDMGDVAFGPLSFSSTRNYGTTAVQYFGWDGDAVVPRFDPIELQR